MRKSHKKKKKKVSSSSAECFSECNLPVLKIWNAWGMCRQMGYDLCILLSCTRYDFGETYFYVPSFFHPIEITHRRKATKLFYFLFFLSIFLCFFVVWKITFEFTWPSTPAVKMRTEVFRGRGGHGAFTRNIILGPHPPLLPNIPSGYSVKSGRRLYIWSEMRAQCLIPADTYYCGLLCRKLK